MTKHNLLAIDLAKNVFQICSMNREQKVIFNRKMTRSELSDFIHQQKTTTIAMEACYSSHYWARQFVQMGHQVKLIPAQHVTPFVRGNKSDQNDALAIAEAARRPNITPVPIKTEAQQDIQSLHRIRERYVNHRTSLINQARGLLSDYGIIAPQGHAAFLKLMAEITEPNNGTLSAQIKVWFREVANEYRVLSDKIKRITETLGSIASSNPLCKILMSIPGVGVINATSIYSAIGNGSQFKNAREFAVWLGVTPRQSSSGESFSSGGITKRGNRYLRKQLIHGARAALSRCKNKTDKLSLWANQLNARRGPQKTTVALAAKIAKIAWHLLHKQECYSAAH